LPALLGCAPQISAAEEELQVDGNSGERRYLDRCAERGLVDVRV
jgi:hypothetical protein